MLRIGINPDSASTQSLNDKLLDPDLPHTIGRYRVLEKLGEGGMGVVYHAEQREPVHREVALKVIKQGMDTKEVVARFESERQALALMDHRNIASVYEAGATDKGRPFFAMEYVKGLPITQHCDRNRLDTNARLRLLIQVCNGVQHAHQKGIIHRDIKPSNVLALIQDDAPLPKIIDFGLAKATAQRLTDRTFYTSMGQLVGTPEYMSPEQMDVGTQDIDTRTDVYSLGVLLYELLVGVLPFDSGQARRQGINEIRRRIREEEPIRPSSRVGTLGDALTSTASHRRTEPAALARQLRGDLDWIVMRAMEKDRTRRYASASELAADIERHLRSEPVLASPPSTLYRVRKFARRHRVGVAAGAMVLAALLIGLFGTGIGLVRAMRAEDLAKLEAQRANREAETATQISNFLSGMFEASDPSQALGTSITVRELLDKGAEQIRTEMVGQPEVQARLMLTIGDVYRRLGLFDQADPLINSSLEIRRRVLGEGHPDTLESIHYVGFLHQERGQLDEAEKYYRQSLEGRRRILGEDDQATLESINDLGVLATMRGEMEKAEDYFRRALEGRRLLLGEDSREVLSSLNNVAFTLNALGRREEALEVYTQALEKSRMLLGADHPDTLRLLNNVGALHLDAGRLTETERYYRESLEGRRRVLADSHPETLSSINNMGFVLTAQGRFDDALPFCREAVEGYRKSLGDEHTLTLQVWGNLGDLYTNMGRYAEAEAVLSDVVARVKSTHPRINVVMGLTTRKYGRALTGLGRFEEAQEALIEAHEILTEAVGAEHGQTGRVAGNLVELYEAWGKTAEAARWRDALPQGE